MFYLSNQKKNRPLNPLIQPNEYGRKQQMKWRSNNPEKVKEQTLKSVKKWQMLGKERMIKNNFKKGVWWMYRVKDHKIKKHSRY